MNSNANNEDLRRKVGWLNDEVGYGTICHDSRGNLVDGLGNPTKVEVVEEEEGRPETTNADLDSNSG